MDAFYMHQHTLELMFLRQWQRGILELVVLVHKQYAQIMVDGRHLWQRPDVVCVHTVAF
jgi:hypothetical protein